MSGSAQSSLSGVVLAGGHSRRMGRNKAFMELDGKPLIARVLDRLAQLCDELIISANDVELYSHLPAKVVADVIPGRGALSGIHAGLAAMRSETALVVACDMPFLNLPLLRFMSVVAQGFDVVVPRIAEYFEPLHAIYRVSCIEPIEKLVADEPRRVVDLYQNVHVREVTEDEVRLFDAELSFFNVNTPAEWAEAQRLSSRKR